MLFSIKSIAIEASVILGLGDCGLLLDYIGGLDVAFKGGEDVRGKKVKRANYDVKPREKLQDIITFDVTADIGSTYDLTEKNIVAQMTLVSVMIKNGRVFINDHLIQRLEAVDLEERCRSKINLN